MQVRLGVDWDNDKIICWDATTANNRWTNPGWQDITKTSSVSNTVEGTSAKAYSLDKWVIGAFNGTATLTAVLPSSVIANSTAYTLSLWVEIADITKITSVAVTVTDPQSLGSVTFNNAALIAAKTSGYYRLNIPFTTDSNSASSTVTITITVIHSSSSTFTLHGKQVVQGSNIVGYNAGRSTNQYDNITSYATKASWRSGRQDYKDNLPATGTANITVNNVSKLFSPSYASGALFNQFKADTLLVIQAYDETSETWRSLWSGYTQNFGADTGTQRDRQATITAVDIMDKIQKAPLYSDIYENVTLDSVINSLALPSVPAGPADPRAVLDQGYIGEVYLTDDGPITISQTSPVGFSVFGDVIPDNRGRLLEMLTRLINVEVGTFLVEGDGTLTFKPRYYIEDTASAVSLISGVDFKDIKYIFYGQKIVNRHKTSHYERRFTDTQLYNWTGLVTLLPGQSYRVRVTNSNTIYSWDDFIYNTTLLMTSQRLTVFNGYGGDTNLGGFNISLSSTRVERVDNRSVDIVFENKTTDLRFKITGITLNGTIIELPSEDDFVSLADTDAMEGVYPSQESITDRIVETSDQALRVSTAYIATRKDETARFDKLVIEPRSSWVSTIPVLVPGTVISVTDAQTGLTNAKHLIIGISATFSETVLTLEYTLAPLQTLGIFRLNNSLLDGDDVLLPYESEE